MAQVVKYRKIPNFKNNQYLSTINKLIGFVHNSSTLSYKQLKEWLSTNNLWNKQDTPIFLTTIGIYIEKKQPVKISDFVHNFFSKNDVFEQKSMLYKRLFSLNPLLVKYVIDALDVEIEGRLHSTHELHRMLSSFVYPGKKVMLEDFKSWIEWAAACDLIHLIGIRWGIGEVGKEFLSDLRSFDVDDYLEDEEDEEDEEFVEELTILETTHDSIASTKTHATQNETVDSSPLLGADLLGAEKSSGQREKAAPKPAYTPRKQQTKHRQRLIQRPAVSLQFTPTTIPEVKVNFSDEDINKNFEYLIKWWETYNDKKILTFSMCGLGEDEFQMNQERFLFISGFISLFLELPEFHTVFDELVSYINYLNEIEFFDIYLEPTLPLEKALEGFDFRFSPSSPNFFRMLINAMLLKKNIADFPTVFVDIESAATPEQLIKTISETLYRGLNVFHAPFWLVREFHRQKMLTGDVHKEISALPLAQGRDAASRLGFSSLNNLKNISEAIELSKQLSKRFDSDSDYAEPLNHIARSFLCRANCPNSSICPMACTEKLPWNRFQ